MKYLHEWCCQCLVTATLKDVTKENVHGAELSPFMEKLCWNLKLTFFTLYTFCFTYLFLEIMFEKCFFFFFFFRWKIKMTWHSTQRKSSTVDTTLEHRDSILRYLLFLKLTIALWITCCWALLCWAVHIPWHFVMFPVSDWWLVMLTRWNKWVS